MGLLSLLLNLSAGESSKSDLKVGDWVEIVTYGEEGEIVEIHGDDYYVEIDEPGNDIDIFKKDELRKIH